MSAMAIGSIVFACVFGSALLGLFIGAALPEHHLSQDSKDVVKLGMGLIATTSALVLGLLIASAKTSFDTQNDEVKQAAANIVLLDRALAHYGPETKGARDLIRRAIAFRLATTWPEDGSRTARLDTPETTPTVESVEDGIPDAVSRSLLCTYFVLPPSTFSLSLAAACAAANRAVSTRNGEHET